MEVLFKRQGEIKFPDSNWTLRMIVLNDAIHYQLFWRDQPYPSHETQDKTSSMLLLLQG